MAGISKFPKSADKYEGEALVFADETTNIVSKVVIVELATYEAPDPTTFVGIYAGAGETDALGTKHNFIVAGELVSYYAAGLTATQGKLYTFTQDNLGVVTANSAEITSSVSGKIVALDGSLVVIGTDSYKMESSLVVVDSTKDFAASELKVGATVNLYQISGKYAYAIIIPNP